MSQSIAAYLSSSSVGVYSGLKHALEIFTSNLRVELAKSGVHVGSIAPGTTETEIFDHLRTEGAPVSADQTPPLEPAGIAHGVRFMLGQPDRANIAKILLVSAKESVSSEKKCKQQMRLNVRIKLKNISSDKYQNSRDPDFTTERRSWKKSKILASYFFQKQRSPKFVRI